MLQKFTTHIDTNFPFLKDKKLLIAISGGLDSVVLTHLFSALHYTIALAHCNFKLRETASDLDEEFVRILSQKTYNQSFITIFETEKYAKESKTSTQIAARELRYAWFQEIIKKNNFDFVLTAHHADDNLETFLINLTRGSGLDGFTGIPAVNGNIIRPLLPFSRAEIMEYAKENKIEWREDASNATTKYIRNKIRHQIVPVLKEINPSLLASFKKIVDNLQESQQIIEDRIKDVSLGVIEKDSSNDLQIIKIDIDKLEQLSNPKAYLYQLLKDYNFTAWNDVYHLLNAQSGKQVFSNTHRLLKNRKFLLLSSKIEIKNQQAKEYFIQKHDHKITHPIAITFEDVLQISIENKNTIYVDKALLKYPLIVRNWQIGDYLYPLGMQGKKKLSKYFKDEKFSLLEKEHAWLLCNADNQIIWVLHRRQDSRLSIENTSKNILKITLE